MGSTWGEGKAYSSDDGDESSAICVAWGGCVSGEGGRGRGVVATEGRGGDADDGDDDDGDNDLEHSLRVAGRL